MYLTSGESLMYYSSDTQNTYTDRRLKRRIASSSQFPALLPNRRRLSGNDHDPSPTLSNNPPLLAHTAAQHG